MVISTELQITTGWHVSVEAKVKLQSLTGQVSILQEISLKYHRCLCMFLQSFRRGKELLSSEPDHQVYHFLWGDAKHCLVRRIAVWRGK